MKWLKTLNPVLWGVTVGLSWMWGLGLFFSVQFTFLYGLPGLLAFAIPNAIGLFLFGVGTQVVAHRFPGPDGLNQFYQPWSRAFRLVFFLYQILAITLTIFAILRYVFQPLQLSATQLPDQAWLIEPLLILPLSMLVVISAAWLFGEEFSIRKIKFSHTAMFLVLLAAIFYLLGDLGTASLLERPVAEVQARAYEMNFWGYFVPICVGLLVGPWLDLQQWQRAIQIRRENTSIAWSYFFGSVIFFGLLLFHGQLALWVMQVAPQFAAGGAHPSIDGKQYAHDLIVRFFDSSDLWTGGDLVPIAYFTFLGICILTTLDSGYLALRWFLSQNVEASKNPIFSLIPAKLWTSPIPSFIFAGVFALAATLIGLELEYFMLFYATFFVGYSALAITRCFIAKPLTTLPQVRMFAMGSLAVVGFSYGYFLNQPLLMILTSLMSLGYVIWLALNREWIEELEPARVKLGFGADDEEETSAAPTLSHASPVEKAPGENLPTALTDGFDGKWFVHSLTATYCDTNSVGNVYFAQYGVWVGKARELFFRRVMPTFDLDHTRFYILTRSYEHKFLRESKEFDTIRIRIRVGDFNRKFATLEHEILNGKGELLGKGRQSLMFVSSDNYALINIPEEVYNAFLPYL